MMDTRVNDMGKPEDKVDKGTLRIILDMKSDYANKCTKATVKVSGNADVNNVNDLPFELGIVFVEVVKVITGKSITPNFSTFRIITNLFAKGIESALSNDTDKNGGVKK